ncbi:MAG: hypothetical protein ACYS9X_14580 [Planctomycetota bacterium]|jgi:hypothetical protein
MRSFARRASAAVIAALALASAVGAAESHVLAFKFTDGEKLTYGIDIELDITTTAERGSQKQESSARTKKLALVMDVVERAAKEGVRAAPELAVTFRDLVVEQELSGAAGEITLEISGSDVVARRGGAVMVDTKKGKGKELAKALLAEFAFIGKEGTLTLRESGRVTKVDGPEAFRSFLAPDSGAGLWVLETKLGAVAVGETWESEERRIRRFHGLDLSTNPLAVKVSYTLEEFSERDGRKVAKIKVRSDLLREKSLSATVTGEALKDARVDIRRLERKAEGTVLFDIDEGRLIESDMKVTLAVEAEMTVKNELTKRDETVKTKVTGAGHSVMKLQPPAPAADKAE